MQGTFCTAETADKEVKLHHNGHAGGKEGEIDGWTSSLMDGGQLEV